MAEKKKVFELSDLLKILGALAVFIPLITAVVQYRQSVKQDLDKNFRAIVKELSSKDREERIAAAANMGTFITKDFYFLKDVKGGYYEEAVDILINRLSTELDYNVLNAIKGSLLKMDKEDYKKNIEKILGINRNMFIQNYALSTWEKDSKNEYTQKENEYNNNLKAKIDKTILGNIKEEMIRKRGIYFDREKDYLELNMHKQVTADFISMFLEGTKDNPIKDLNFYQISMNESLMIGLKLFDSKFKSSALSSSTINETDFNGSTIIDTVFTSSDLTKSSFKGCTITASLFDQAILKGVDFSDSETTKTKFKDVFFVGSDLTGANFTGIPDLQPEYFYGAKNIDKAVFDDEKSKKEMAEKVKKVEEKEDDFIRFINKSELTEQRKDGLFSTLCKLKYPKGKYPKDEERNSCKENFKKIAQEISK